MEIFNPSEGIVTEAVEQVRDVSADIARAEAYVRNLSTPVAVEDLVSDIIASGCSITRSEAFDVIQRISAELQPETQAE